MDSADSRSDWFSGVAGAAAGMGILTFVLFPLAIPMVLLTIVAALPFVLPLFALAAIVLILAGAWFGIRAAGRVLLRLGRGIGHSGGTRPQAERRPATRSAAPDGRLDHGHA